MEHLQKIIYLLSLFMPVMVFFTFGLWLAWAKWFKHCRSFGEAHEEYLELVEKLNELNLKQTVLFENCDNSPALLKIKSQQEALIQLENSLVNSSSENEIQGLKIQLKDLETKLEKDHLVSLSLQGENENLREKLSLFETAQHDDTFSGIDIVQAILNDFADDPVSNDLELGILFHEKPDTADDLTALEQLSSNIAWKLNDLGVYRYRQIALWTHAQFVNILGRLSLDTKLTLGKNGLWQEQASKLHQETDHLS